MVIAKGDEWGQRVHKQGVVCTRSDHDVFLHQAFPVRGDIAHTIGSETGKRSAIKQFDNRTQWRQLPFDVIKYKALGVLLVLNEKPINEEQHLENIIYILCGIVLRLV